MTDDEFDQFLSDATAELESKQESLALEFGVGHSGRFVVEYRTHTLTFFNHEAPSAVATIIPVATHVPSKNSLKWAWANEHFPAEVRDAASQVKGLHGLTGYEFFANEVEECDESQAWEATAMACKHLNAIGAYRIPHGEVFSYVLIREIRHAI